MVKADGRRPRKINAPSHRHQAGATWNNNAGEPGILAVPPQPLRPMTKRRFNPVTVQRATQDSPTLAGLAARALDAQQRLRAVEDLIPAELHAAVLAGPADGDTWCLLVQGSAAAAKLRQLAPALVVRLKAKGWAVETIRLKVRGAALR